jgi:hypothetical protein
LTETIWSKVISRLRGDFEVTHRRERHRSEIGIVPSVPFTSKILSEIPSVLSEFGQKRWTLYYRGTRDGFKSSDFHGKCDGCLNTITLIETTKGYIFGGFTRIGWDSSNSVKRDDSRESFIFTIQNPHNISSRKFALLDPSKAIECYSWHGPRFGSNADISIADGSNTNASSYSHLGGGYVNGTGVNGQEVFTGELYFTVKEIEVFTIDD